MAFRRKLNIDEPFRKSVEYNVSYFIIKTFKETDDYSFKIAFLTINTSMSTEMNFFIIKL